MSSNASIRSAANHSRMLWTSRLSTALRTALACAFVAAATLYSPPAVRRHLKFTGFSYMSAVLIVEEATLGDSIKGAVCALYGTALGLLPSTLALHMLHPKDISAAAAAAAVAISSFAVLVFDSTALITKRVALAQIVLVYVDAFKESGRGVPLLDPVPVAASTAAGAVAAVLALAFPYPKLACFQASEKSELYVEAAQERLRLMANGICAENSASMAACTSQAKSLGTVCGKALQTLKLIQGGMRWERPLFRFLSLPGRERCELLQEIETPLQGMEMALAASSAQAPLRVVDQQFKDALISQTNQIITKLGQHPSEILDQGLEASHVIAPHNLQHLPSIFFLFCAKLFRNAARSSPTSKSPPDNKIIPTSEDTASSCEQAEASPTRMRFKVAKVSAERVVIALKGSLSLGIAVLLGVLFSPENGKWSGLTVAIAFTPFAGSTFRSAGVRAHGTALGSVYGVLGSLISQNLMEARLLALLPWIIFATFLYRSRMYGPVGGFAATISATIILGRRDYGPPMIFAMQRLTETCMGLCCAVAFELLLQPERASTLARARLAESLGTLRECLGSAASPAELTEGEMKLRERVDELRKSIADAELEPNFWFLPFPVACYGKLHASLAKMSDFLLFMAHGMELEIDDTVRGYLGQCRNLTDSSVKCFQDVLRIKSVAILEGDAGVGDIEMGRCSNLNEDECSRAVDSLLRYAKNAAERLDEGESGESRSEAVLCLAALGFCRHRRARPLRARRRRARPLRARRRRARPRPLRARPLRLHPRRRRARPRHPRGRRSRRV